MTLISVKSIDYCVAEMNSDAIEVNHAELNSQSTPGNLYKIENLQPGNLRITSLEQSEALYLIFCDTIVIVLYYNFWLIFQFCGAVQRLYICRSIFIL